MLIKLRIIYSFVLVILLTILLTRNLVGKGIEEEAKKENSKSEVVILNADGGAYYLDIVGRSNSIVVKRNIAKNQIKFGAISSTGLKVNENVDINLLRGGKVCSFNVDNNNLEIFIVYKNHCIQSEKN
jgi:hypothetical protein